MKTSQLAVTLFGMLLASTVAAQSFSGLYIAAGGSMQAMQAKDSSRLEVFGSTTETNIDIGQDSLQGQVALGYLHKLSDPFLIGVEIGKQLGQGPTMNNATTSDLPFSGNSFSFARQWQMHPGWWLALKPSVKVGNDSLAFIKLARHWASGTFNDRVGFNCTDPANALGCVLPSSESFSANTQGTGIGAGLQTRLTDKLFLMVEVERVSYGTISRSMDDPATNLVLTDSLKPRTITGMISLGYWF
jgi:opacity protein-like surface antigen